MRLQLPHSSHPIIMMIVIIIGLKWPLRCILRYSYPFTFFVMVKMKFISRK